MPARRPNLKQTHTYVILELSPSAYQEIFDKLKEAGYDHAFHEDEGVTVIDMQGIAVAKEHVPTNPFERIPGLDRHKEE